MLNALAHDLRVTLCQWRKTPAFFALAVGILALETGRGRLTPRDDVAVAPAVAALLASVALGAIVRPAWRAASQDPVCRSEAREHWGPLGPQCRA